ncbi:MAG TPA: DUF917 domain-containing protein [Rhabdochlamydiaceae bacterium]
MKEIKSEDMQALALGCALLGSGGGGNPAYDLLIAEYALKQHGPIKLISMEELAEDALVVPLAFVGAPLIATEKLPSGREFQAIIAHLQKLDKKLVLMPAEIGGANGLSAFAVAAKMGLPVLDADTVGRAFPELQMSSCNLQGIKASPAYFADSLGNLAQVDAEDSQAVERIGRHISISMGSSCGVAIYLMTGREAKTAAIPDTVSQALEIGNALLDARREGANLIAKLLEITDGVCLTIGVVHEVQQEIKKGFLQGSVKIRSEAREVELIYQNEYLLAKEGEEILATTPDILAIVELESGTPITSDGLRYGLQVALLAIPAPKMWQTDLGLTLVGPKYFGYPVSYIPIKNKENLV